MGANGSLKFTIPKLIRDLDRSTVIVTPASTDYDTVCKSKHRKNQNKFNQYRKD